MKEKVAFDYKYCLSEDEENNYSPASNLKLRKGTFHPSKTFTGLQLSYMVNCTNGLILKINHNPNPFQKESTMFHKSFAPIVATDEQNFPRGKDPFSKSRANDGDDSRKHIYREFFAGHRYKVLLMEFVEGGSTMITLDIKGYVFLWVYDKTSFTGELTFKPTIKLKLELTFTRFIEENSIRIFPDKRKKK